MDTDLSLVQTIGNYGQNHFYSMKRIICLLLLPFFLCFCASGSAVVTGTARPPIDPNSVKIVGEYPTDREYEIIGLVTASSDAGWSADGDIEYAKEELKKQAAKIGANVVVIEGTSQATNYIYTSSMILPSTSHSLSGKALYVSKTPKKKGKKVSSKENNSAKQHSKNAKQTKPSKKIHMAILETISNGVIQPHENQYLTNVLREEAVKVLPTNLNFIVMTRENISAMLPPDKPIEECEGSCLVETGRNISSDYIAQARISTFGQNITISAELYQTSSGNLISSFNAKSPDIESLETEIRKNAPDMFNSVIKLELDK